MNDTSMRSRTQEQLYVGKIAQGFIASQVLFAANNHGLFAYLEEYRSVEDVARKMGWTPHATQKMLDAVLALKLVDKNNGLYRNSAIASACLVPGRSGFQGDIINHLQDTSQLWWNLEQILHSGTECSFYDTLENSSERAYILGMDNLAQTTVSDVLATLNLATCNTLLDLGCGPATYAAAFLERYPGLKVTLFDRREVFDIAAPVFEQAKMNGRCTVRSGDMLKDDIGCNYDCIFASNIIHFNDSKMNRQLMEKCFKALNPGGILAIKDFILNDDRTGPPYALMFGLHMFVCTDVGATYSKAEITSWANEAGFGLTQVTELNPQNRLFTATKRSHG